MDQFLGAITTIAVGVIGVAAIYQLSQPGGNALASTAGSVVNTTVTGGLFKGPAAGSTATKVG
jgi:hypothetical protein